MDLFSQIIKVYPELDNSHFSPEIGKIHLKDDGDGIVYIKKWDYEKPIPAGLKLGK